MIKMYIQCEAPGYVGEHNSNNYGIYNELVTGA